MENNNRKRTRKRKSKDGKKIHPKVSYTALNIYDESGIKYSDAMEEYAIVIASSNTQLIAKKEITKYKIETLEQEIIDIEEEAANKILKKQDKLEEAKNELRTIELMLENYLPADSHNMENALNETMKLVKEKRLKANGQKWGIERVPIKAVEDIAKHNHVKLITLLSKLDNDVVKTWIDV